MPTSIDLSNIVELRSLSDIVETLNDAARGIVERWLIVGATARDLILHHVYHLPISRATIDLDIAVAVPSWAAFEVLQQELLKRGAELHPRITHRFVLRKWQIDIIPFGGIEENGVIFWPPSNDTKMSVLGFDEKRARTRSTLPFAPELRPPSPHFPLCCSSNSLRGKIATERFRNTMRMTFGC